MKQEGKHYKKRYHPLTSRQLEVIKLVSGGLTNKEIADELNISTQTVKNHLTDVFVKTGYTNRTSLALDYAETNNFLKKLTNKKYMNKKLKSLLECLIGV